MRTFLSLLGLALLAFGAWYFVGSGAPPTLGPVDGFDLPPTEIDRVAVGTTAPDFSLESFSGDVLTLSDYRGEKDILLVFYRGHW